MRLFWIGSAAGLAFISGGLLLYTEGMQPHVSSVPIIPAQPRHPVTTAMTSETASMSRKVAPAFSVKDVSGKTVSIGSPNADRPQFVYFVLDGCPCSFDAEPIFQDLSQQFKGQVDFVTVTDGDAKKAKQWWMQMSVPYSVISDPKLDLMKAYGATNALFSALISRDGHIVKMWPGYSIDILHEMNRLMAKEAGIPEKPFDTKYAPKDRSSGCAYFLG
jgi:peroxiredoxin